MSSGYSIFVASYRSESSSSSEWKIVLSYKTLADSSDTDSSDSSDGEQQRQPEPEPTYGYEVHQVEDHAVGTLSYTIVHVADALDPEDPDLLAWTHVGALRRHASQKFERILSYLPREQDSRRWCLDALRAFKEHDWVPAEFESASLDTALAPRARHVEAKPAPRPEEPSSPLRLKFPRPKPPRFYAAARRREHDVFWDNISQQLATTVSPVGC